MVSTQEEHWIDITTVVDYGYRISMNVYADEKALDNVKYRHKKLFGDGASTTWQPGKPPGQNS